ncbi:MAG TPA: YitT family protein [Exilispira sp.]|nr:YitT family protein [Exilispira sp.]
MSEKKAINNKKISNEIRSYLIIALGMLINSIGWAIFLIPSKMVGGGVSGIAALLFYGFKIPVGLSIIVINLILVLLGMKLIGSSFGIKTVFGIVSLSIFITIIQKFVKGPVVSDTLLSSIIGGIFLGGGIGIAFSSGGSSGGTDIIAMIINKYWDLPPGKVIFFLDVLIIACSYLLVHSIERIIYGYVTMAVTAYTIDLVLEGSKQSVQLIVVTKSSESIANRITSELKRGVTLLPAIGWYTKQKADMLLILVRKYELQDCLSIIKQEDPTCFTSVSSVMGVYGKGFDQLKKNI